jgi:hypothetical protein
MGRLGLTELLIVPAILFLGALVGFVVGFLVGKGAGFKDGLREAERLRAGGRHQA